MVSRGAPVTLVDNGGGGGGGEQRLIMLRNYVNLTAKNIGKTWSNYCASAWLLKSSLEGGGGKGGGEEL